MRGMVSVLKLAAKEKLCKVPKCRYLGSDLLPLQLMPEALLLGAGLIPLLISCQFEFFFSF